MTSEHNKLITRIIITMMAIMTNILITEYVPGTMVSAALNDHI